MCCPSRRLVSDTDGGFRCVYRERAMVVYSLSNEEALVKRTAHVAAGGPWKGQQEAAP